MRESCSVGTCRMAEILLPVEVAVNSDDDVAVLGNDYHHTVAATRRTSTVREKMLRADKVACDALVLDPCATTDGEFDVLKADLTLLHSLVCVSSRDNSHCKSFPFEGECSAMKGPNSGCDFPCKSVTERPNRATERRLKQGH